MLHADWRKSDSSVGMGVTGELEVDSRDIVVVYNIIIDQYLGVSKFILGTRAWGNKTKKNVVRQG